MIIEIRKKASEELIDNEFDGSVWADIIIKNICIFVIGNGSGRFAATDEKGIR